MKKIISICLMVLFSVTFCFAVDEDGEKFNLAMNQLKNEFNQWLGYVTELPASELQQQLEEIEKRIKTLVEQLDDHNHSIDALKSAMADLNLAKDSIPQLKNKTEIELLQLSNKKQMELQRLKMETEIELLKEKINVLKNLQAIYNKNTLKEDL